MSENMHVFKFQLDTSGTQILAYREGHLDSIQFAGPLATAVSESLDLKPLGEVYCQATIEVGLAHEGNTITLRERVTGLDW
jgi:hypothetical protein